MMYEIILKEKQRTDGLKPQEIMEMMPLLGDAEVYPIEIEAKTQESVAMGFISQKAADILDFDYDNSGLKDFIALILDDVNNESDNCEYEFRGIRIWMGR